MHNILPPWFTFLKASSITSQKTLRWNYRLWYMQQKHVMSFFKKVTWLLPWLGHLRSNCGSSECAWIDPSNAALTGKDRRPARVAGTVLVPVYAHVLPSLSPRLQRNDDGMQVNHTSQGKTFTVKKARKFLSYFCPLRFHSWGMKPVTLVTGVRRPSFL